MELATPPSAARAPVAWYSWWLMPLALGGGTVAATFMSSERITAAAAGAAATAASAVCVRLLIRTQAQLRRSESGFRTSQAEHSQQWQQHVAGLERKFSAERATLEAQLTEHSGVYEIRLADSSGAYEAQLAEQARAFEERLTQQAASYEAQLADQAEVWQEQLAHQLGAVARLADEQLPDALEQLRAGDSIDDLLPAANQCAKVSAELQAELSKVLRISLIGVEEEFNRSTAAEQAVISIGNRIHVLTSKLRGRRVRVGAGRGLWEIPGPVLLEPGRAAHQAHVPDPAQMAGPCVLQVVADGGVEGEVEGDVLRRALSFRETEHGVPPLRAGGLFDRPRPRTALRGPRVGPGSGGYEAAQSLDDLRRVPIVIPVTVHAS